MRRSISLSGRARPQPALIAASLGLLLVASVGLAPASASESRKLIELLDLDPGKVAADVGAGEGRFTKALARVVGPSGHVYATEVETSLLSELASEMVKENLSNVTTVLGDQSRTGLPDACCDAILLRMVYHHFEDPAAMRRSLHASLKPAGLLAIVDINPQRHWRRLEGVPDRGGHGIEPQVLIEELVSDGFELVSLHEDWNGDDERYCAVFRSPGRSIAASLQ